MAQTRTITPAKLRKLAALDLALRPILAFAPRPGPAPRGIFAPERILVVEIWGLGDVVLATPALAELRERFPSAGITLLAKPKARELLAESGLVDDVIAVDFPWTACERKFAPSRYDLAGLKDLFRELRSRRFDVSLDARRDIRSNIVTYLSGAKRRIGYDFGRATHLLTDVLPSGSQNAHRIDDWLRLLQPLVGEVPNTRGRVLRIAQAERSAGRRTLGELGFTGERPIVAIDAGSNAEVRRLQEDVVAGVAAGLIENPGVDVVFNIDPSGYGANFRLPAAVRVLRPGLRELMAILAEVDALVCTDSAAMHIAAALGTPVTAVYGPAPWRWFGPLEPEHRVVTIEDMPCRPCFDACIHPSPICMDRITSDIVLRAVRSQLAPVATIT
ncbi:lipopolysaccharide heptosyltransferase II [soil metagenome]